MFHPLFFASHPRKPPRSSPGVAGHRLPRLHRSTFGPCGFHPGPYPLGKAPRAIHQHLASTDLLLVEADCHRILDGSGWAFSRLFLVLTMELSSAIAVIYQNVLPFAARLAMRNDAGAISSKHGKEKRNMTNSPGKNSENHGQLHGSRNGNVGKRWEEVIKTEHYPTCVHCTRSTQFWVLCVHLVI